VSLVVVLVVLVVVVVLVAVGSIEGVAVVTAFGIIRFLVDGWEVGLRLR
jgi:hypothetical protein